MSATHIIKKYPNRRLYDTEISSYITIEDVRQLIIAGKNFEVHDARTGASLTRSVLLQIILDKEQGETPILSTQLLRQIIRLHDNPGHESVNHYLERSMQLFLEQWQPLHSIGNLTCQTQWNAMSRLAEHNLESWQNSLANQDTPHSASPSEEEDGESISSVKTAPDNTHQP
ncbi:MAG: polyhydroxyalkanoate synthesis repressor PhaR [Xanthomonadaceae bacterium]|jgi:polyhydroxyalkanoate synthesis repressor PhaR|nr:polyhydroxyalkanoate synthesis repressor PhaR [Xanthomonadaceae bacterium]